MILQRLLILLTILHACYVSVNFISAVITAADAEYD